MKTDNFEFLLFLTKQTTCWPVTGGLVISHVHKSISHLGQRIQAKEFTFSWVPFQQHYVWTLWSSCGFEATYWWPAVLCWGRKHGKVLILCHLMSPLQVGTPQIAPQVKGIKMRSSTVYMWDDFISFIQRVNVDQDKTFILQGSYIFSAFFVPFACCVLNRESQSFLPWILSFSCPEFE